MILVAFAYLFVIFCVVSPFISIKNEGVVDTVKKVWEVLYLYWSGNLLLELGIHAEEY